MLRKATLANLAAACAVPRCFPGRPAPPPNPGLPPPAGTAAPLQARILVHGKVTHLGYYETEEEAARVYDK